MRSALLISLLTIANILAAQQRSFDFLEMAADAHVTALGGYSATATGFVPGSYLENPALFSDSLLNYWAVGTMFLPSSVSLVQATGVVGLGKLGPVHMGARRMGYGQMAGYDEAGNYTGDFDSSSSSLMMGTAWNSGHFNFGATLKWAYAHIAGFSANALMADLGATFVHPGRQLVVGLAMRNLGFILNDFTGSGGSKLPFDLRLGATFKPEHAPFRFTFTAYDLTGWNSYVMESPEFGWGKKMSSFLNVGLELLLNSNVELVTGYNFRRRYEMKLENGAYGAGWSGGIRIRKKNFVFQYARAGMNAAGAINHFSLALNAGQLFGLNSRENE